MVRSEWIRTVQRCRGDMKAASAIYRRSRRRPQTMLPMLRTPAAWYVCHVLWRDPPRDPTTSIAAKIAPGTLVPIGKVPVKGEFEQTSVMGQDSYVVHESYVVLQIPTDPAARYVRVRLTPHKPSKPSRKPGKLAPSHDIPALLKQASPLIRQGLAA